MSEILEKLNYVNPVKYLTSAFKAGYEAFKGKSGERFKIFWDTFKAEMSGKEKEEAKAKEEAEKAVSGNLDDNIKAMDEAIGFKGTPEEKTTFDEVKMFAVRGYANLKVENRKSAYTGLKKFNKAVKGEATEPLNFDEAGSLAAVGLSTLAQLKKKYPKQDQKDEFKKALDKFAEASRNSSYPLAKVLSMSTLAIFKVDTGSGFNLDNVSKKLAAKSFIGKFGMDASDAETLADLKENPMENKDKVVEVFKGKLFPNSDAEPIVDKINELVIQKPNPLDTQSLADLVYLIDDRDLDRLIKILGGNQ